MHNITCRVGWFMAFYNEDIIEEIRSNNDIVDVVGEYVQLKRTGKDYMGLCPFHNEKTPSFSVVPSKQIFYCFGCKTGGDVLRFIRLIENLNYKEAIEFLAERAGIQLPENESEEEKKKLKIKNEIININTEAARFFYNQIFVPENKEARDYLQKRGIGNKILNSFGIGYCPKDRSALLIYLKNKGFSEKSIHASGLIYLSKSGAYYDRFSGRIMFPIFDVKGNVIGFGGRIIDESGPKYMNSPETLVYHKGRHLYGMNFAKHSNSKSIFVVEGYMDVISLHQNGIINAVASLGTALTEEQGKILKRYAEEVIIAYDADAAGQAATMRGLDILQKLGCSVKVLEIPKGKDPDEFIKENGKEAFEKIAEKSYTLIEYKAKQLKKEIDNDSTEGKIRFLSKMAELLARIDNNVEREMYVKKLADEYDISRESILSEVYKKIKPKENLKASAKISSANVITKNSNKSLVDTNNKIIHYERIILALICVDNRIYKYIKDRISPDIFTDNTNRELASFLFKHLENNRGIGPGELMGSLDNDISDEFSKIFVEECNFEDNMKAANDLLIRIEEYRLDIRQKEIVNMLSNGQAEKEGNVEKLKEELKSILLKKRKILQLP